jgi:O-antigen/teichoic acid export membrane protein
MSDFARSVFRLGGGNVAAQIISILAVPVITRIYAPDQFGAFSFVFSIVAVLFPISTLRLNTAILLPKDERTADDLLLLSTASVIFSALLVMPIMVLALDNTAMVDESTRSVLWFLVAGVLVHGLVQCFEFWLLRHRQFGVMAWGAVSESVADRLFAILMGITQQALAMWLALGRVVGATVHLLMFLARTSGTATRPRIGQRTLASRLETLRRYRRFPLYSTWAFLFANGARELPTLVFAGLFSTTVAGMYALGVRVLGFPMLMIGDAVAKVFFRYATGLTDQPARLSESTRLLVRSLIYLIFPPMLLLSVAGPPLFEFVFGNEWLDAGRFAQVLAMSFLVTFLYRVLGIFFDIHEKQATRLAFDASQFMLRIGGMMLGGMMWGVEGALWGLLLATLLVYGAGTVYLLSLVGLTAASSIRLFAHALMTLMPISVATLAICAAGGGGGISWLLVLAGLVAQWFWFVRREPRLVNYARKWAR